MTKVSVQRIGENLYRSQPTNPLTGRRLNILGSTPGDCIARREKVKGAIRDYRAGLITADQLSGVLVDCEARRVVKVRELWKLWADDLELRAKRGAVTRSWARQCRACGALHLGELGDRHPSELAAPVVERWLQGLTRWHRGAGHKEATNTGELLSEQHQRAVWAKLQACVRWGQEERLVGKLPWSRAPETVPRRVRKRDAARSGDELAKLLAVASERDRLAGNGDLMMRLGIMSLLGVRAGEAVALAWDQVRELPSGRIEVSIQFQRKAHQRAAERAPGRPTDDPKWGSARSPTFAPDHPVVVLLRAQRARLESLGLFRSTGPVFPTRRGGWRGRDVVKPEVLRSLAREAGLERPRARWTQHSTRHSAGTLQAAGGATRHEIRDFMGHATLEVTEGYIARAVGGASGDAAGKELARALGAASAAARTREMFALPEAPLDRLDPVEVVEAVRPEKDAARAYKEKELGREIYDAGEAFAEWLAMGAPIEAKKTRGAREAPPLVRHAAKKAGDRAADRAKKLLPEDWNNNPVIVEACREKLAKARELAERNTLNKWKGLRKKLAREALQAGAELPEHVCDWLGQ